MLDESSLLQLSAYDRSLIVNKGATHRLRFSSRLVGWLCRHSLQLVFPAFVLRHYEAFIPPLMSRVRVSSNEP